MRENLHNIFEPSDCVKEDVLLRYVQDRLPPSEKHHVEHHLTECELCSDAVEGLRLVKEKEEVAPVIANLRKNAAIRTQGGARIIRFDAKMRWAAAAAIIILVVTGVWISHFVQTQNESQLAEAPEAVTLQKNERFASDKNAPAPVEEPAAADSESVVANGNLSSLSLMNAEPEQKHERKKEKEEMVVILKDESADAVAAREREDNTPATIPAEPTLQAAQSPAAATRSGTYKTAIADSTTVREQGNNLAGKQLKDNKRKAEAEASTDANSEYLRKPKQSNTREAAGAPVPVRAEPDDKGLFDTGNETPGTPVYANEKGKKEEVSSYREKLDKKDYKGALLEARTALAEDSSSYSALYCAGVAAYHLSDFEISISYLEKIASAGDRSEYADVLWHLALSYEAAGNKPNAISTLERLVALNKLHRKEAEKKLEALKK